MVDYVAVQSSGILQVSQLLPDGVCSNCTVDAVGSRKMVKQELQLIIVVCLAYLADLVGHEIGEHLLHPYIVEPSHRYQVSKPHMRGFMGDEVSTGVFLVAGCT